MKDKTKTAFSLHSVTLSIGLLPAFNITSAINHLH